MSDDEGKRPRGRERFRSERNYDYLDNDGGRGGGGGGGGPGPVPYRRFGGGGDRYQDGGGGFRGGRGQRSGNFDDKQDRRRRERDFDPESERGDFNRRRYDDQEELPLPKKKAVSKDEEEPITFREFLLRERDDISPEEAKAKYEEYVAQIRKRQPKLFFEDHKMEEWFREKYHPAAIRARAKLVREEASERAKDFRRELEEKGASGFKELVSDLMKDDDRRDDPEEESKEQLKVATDGSGNGSEDVEKASSRVKKDGDVDRDEDDEHGKNTDVVDTVFLRNIPPKVHRGLTRYAWAKYDSAEAARKACELLRGKSIKSGVRETEGGDEATVLYRFEPVMNKDRDRRTMRTNILPKIAASAPRLKHDAEQVERVMRHLDKYRETAEFNPLTPEYLESIPESTKRLDLCVHYLHRVHLYSYYSGLEYLEDPTAQPTPATRPRIDPNVEIALSGSGEKGNWERKVDDRVDEIMCRSTDRPRSGASDAAELREKRLQEWFNANTKYEDEGRYRCALPPKKLFRGVEFVHKHLRLRHADAMEKVLEAADEEQFLENYVNDPNKLDGASVQEHPFPAGNRPPMRGGFMAGPPRGGAMFGMQPRPPTFYPSWGRGAMPQFIPGRGRGMVMPPPMGVGAVDPRASRMPAYNDLDAPADGPNIQLVKYDDR